MENKLLTAPGLIPDPYDGRDRIHRSKPIGKLPDAWSFHGYAPMAMNQGQTGSCAAFAGMAFIHTLTSRMLGKANAIRCNPWDLYANTRILQGTFPKDSGSNIRSLMRTMNETGVVPHNFGRNSVTAKPVKYPGRRFKIRGYERLISDDPLNELKNVLYRERLPVVVGMALPRGYVPSMIRSGTLSWGNVDLNDVYWHGMLAIGWDQTRIALLNSWGIESGLHGWVWVENEYFLNQRWTPDKWTVPLSHA